MEKDKISKQQYEALYESFKHFNKRLFNNELPGCFLSFSRGRKRRTAGFFKEKTWLANSLDKKDSLHEISISPDHIGNDLRDVMSTLVHEMVHLWQVEFGKPSRNGYHNKEWAKKMILVGLFPSNTGIRGGKTTGPSMSHYVLEGKAFDKAFNTLPGHCILPLVSVDGLTIESLNEYMKEVVIGDETLEAEEVKAIANATRRKVKYNCPSCNTNVWGKPSLNVLCGDCQLTLTMSL